MIAGNREDEASLFLEGTGHETMDVNWNRISENQENSPNKADQTPQQAVKRLPSLH